ncbi:hypothetical protein MGYG_07269 [Nannizzia gypsea CBS 118893]|uniref:Uncharacterized protein n=1 Tax=Arthroderma gypseum (strain ATCC MYA-4604 / CBS 118893) TaxID=535722 RepID=E4V2J5_ARTGP|nr:hypothetical protein MGYG_07269 [Nannizzia gypsea CBS 118893]EFR04260.1 hypothetical protein MGYG_07269 [Nannizzia gypsea CBS 118893]
MIDVLLGSHRGGRTGVQRVGRRQAMHADNCEKRLPGESETGLGLLSGLQVGLEQLDYQNDVNVSLQPPPTTDGLRTTTLHLPCH